MKNILLFLCLIFSAFSARSQPNYPKATIKNQHLQATLYLPDAEQGYYRSTRFDWAGVIGSLTYRGHQYFGNWLDEHEPTNPESISGPVEAFAPIGYEEANPGDLFLVIGVGMLRKPDNEPYHFMTRFEIVDGGTWEVQKKQDQVTFVHQLSSEEGYGYEYTKTVRLMEGQPRMVLAHTLKNTGEKPLETTVYNHNFFIIDSEPTGPPIETTFAAPVRAEGKGFGEVIVAQDQQLLYQQALQPGENVFTPNVEGLDSDAEAYDIRIENTKSGAGVHITGNRPLLKLVYWASYTTACPEPYLQVHAPSRKTYAWDIDYEYYTLQ